MHSRLTKQGIAFICTVFSFLVALGPSLAGNIVSNNSSALTYGVSRLAESEVNNDTTFGLVWSQVFVIALPITFIVYARYG